MSDLIFFTDLDGTLLDHRSYSFEPAGEAISALNRADICWILNSSKTLAELSELRKKLHHRHPLIVENGAGIAIPEGYTHPLWHGLVESMPGSMSTTDGFRLHAMGLGRKEILARIEPLKQAFRFEGFADMSVERLVELTGLGETDAAAARDRHFSEPLLWLDSEARLSDFAAEVGRLGLSLLHGGRFVHVMGGADKGRAMAWLLQGYGGTASAEERPLTVAIGDSQNDVAMLAAADIAVLVRSPVHAPPKLDRVAGERDVRLTEEEGPAGWNSAVLSILEDNHD